MNEERGGGAQAAAVATEDASAAPASGASPATEAASPPAGTEEAATPPPSPAGEARSEAEAPPGKDAGDDAAGNGASAASLAGRRAGGIELVMRIPVTVEVVLGTARMTVAELMQLGPGATVLLDRHVGEPIDVMVNGRLVARGEVVVDENDETRLGIRLTEIVEPGVMC